ncbi:MAG: hypothetical protein ACYC54_10285 [Sedimentisphaerales bacterium]
MSNDARRMAVDELLIPADDPREAADEWREAVNDPRSPADDCRPYKTAFLA